MRQLLLTRSSVLGFMSERHGYRSLTTHFVRIFLCNHWFFFCCAVGVEVSILVSENVCECFTAKCVSITFSRVVLVLRWLQCVVQTSALCSSDATRIHKQLVVNQRTVVINCACARYRADVRCTRKGIPSLSTCTIIVFAAHTNCYYNHHTILGPLASSEIHCHRPPLPFCVVK